MLQRDRQHTCQYWQLLFRAATILGKQFAQLLKKRDANAREARGDPEVAEPSAISIGHILVDFLGHLA